MALKAFEIQTLNQLELQIVIEFILDLDKDTGKYSNMYPENAKYSLFMSKP